MYTGEQEDPAKVVAGSLYYALSLAKVITEPTCLICTTLLPLNLYFQSINLIGMSFGIFAF